jgi:epoxyqueuosine reductase
MDYAALKERIGGWASELGFQGLGVADADLSAAEPRLLDWLARGWHGEMEYMASPLRAHPEALRPGTLRVISCRMNYLNALPERLAADKAQIAKYAQGRDYHKVLRARLQALCDRIQGEVGEFGYRVFTDSAPVMEVELAVRAGIGWRGKHTLLLDRDAGSWFFLGEIYCDLPLPVDAPQSEHCGTCRRCIDVCPTQAIVGPYQLDARRCISYLTIEHKSAIPEAMRSLIGNRVYGCDDCQSACPWNGFARPSGEKDFEPRHGLDDAALVDLFAWTEDEFEERTRGSAIRRIGYERWLRNLAVGLGNAPTTRNVLDALNSKRNHPSALVREHVEWALTRHGE